MNFVLAQGAKDICSVQLEYTSVVSCLDIISSNEIAWNPLVFLLSWSVFVSEKWASAMQFDRDTCEKGLTIELQLLAGLSINWIIDHEEVDDVLACVDPID